MAANPLEYRSPMYEARHKTKLERAADLFNQARKLAREALEEQNRESALDAEYGPARKGQAWS